MAHPIAALHSSLQAATGQQLGFHASWQAMFEAEGIGPGDFHARQLAWINQRLGTSHGALAPARQAFALAQGKTWWPQVDAIYPADVRLLLDFVNGVYALHNGTVLVGHALGALPGSAFSRASLANGYTKPGATIGLAEFAANAPRIVVDPLTGEGLGYLSEQLSKRISKFPNTPMTNWGLNFGGTKTASPLEIYPGFTDAAVVPSGGATWHRANAGTGGSVTAGVPLTCVAVYAPGTSGRVLVIVTGTASAGVGGNAGSVWVDHESGGPITNLVRTALPSGGYVITFTWTPNFTGPVNFGIGAFSTVADQTVIAGGGWIETAPTPTSPIVFDPGSVDVVRQKDDQTITGLGSQFPAGANPYLVTDVVMPDRLPEAGEDMYVGQLYAGPDDFMRLLLHNSGSGPRFLADVWAGGQQQRQLHTFAIPAGGERAKLAVSFNSARSFMALNGVIADLDAAPPQLPSVALGNYGVMQDLAGDYQPNTTVRNQTLGVGVKDEAWGISQTL